MLGNQLFMKRLALVVVIVSFLCGIDLCAMESEKTQSDLSDRWLRIYEQAGLDYENSDGLSMKSSSGSQLVGISKSDTTEQEAESLQHSMDFQKEKMDFQKQKDQLEEQLRSDIEGIMEESRQSKIKFAQIKLQTVQQHLAHLLKDAGYTKTMFNDPDLEKISTVAIADAEADVQKINQELKDLQISNELH